MLCVARHAGPRVVLSSNVLAENLHTERHLETTHVLYRPVDHTYIRRHLETTYYVTSLKQMTDFAWYRGSGVRVNVAARDINVVPAYDDVIDAGSDNAFVLTNPDASVDDLQRFSDISRRYCRSVRLSVVLINTPTVYVFGKIKQTASFILRNKTE